MDPGTGGRASWLAGKFLSANPAQRRLDFIVFGAFALVIVPLPARELQAQATASCPEKAAQRLGVVNP